MPKIQYKNLRFIKRSEKLIEMCNVILEDYKRQGFDLTLRQLYYQLVSRNVIKNEEKSYNNLGKLVSSARYAGLIDWTNIVDRVRNIRSSPNWSDPSEIISSCANQFHVDWWKDQESRVEVWVEKEALMGIIAKVGRTYDVPYFTTKGYNSDSEMWRASQRFIQYSKDNITPIIIYLGDHDPSGLDMTRDIKNRLWTFGADVDVRRVALNYEQTQDYDLPENPAKETDSRFKDYEAEYGTNKSWELDALSPSIIVTLISDEIEEILDMDLFKDQKFKEKRGREVLGSISKNYASVLEYLQTI